MFESPVFSLREQKAIPEMESVSIHLNSHQIYH